MQIQSECLHCLGWHESEDISDLSWKKNIVTINGNVLHNYVTINSIVTINGNVLHNYVTINSNVFVHLLIIVVTINSNKQ